MGCLDHAVGHIVPTKVTEIWHRCHIQSFLVIVETKTKCAVSTALLQLLIYLASLHQAQMQQCQTNASVYSVASDGYIFKFIKITHKGTVMISRY